MCERIKPKGEEKQAEKKEEKRESKKDKEKHNLSNLLPISHPNPRL